MTSKDSLIELANTFTDIESRKQNITAANDIYILEIDLCYALQIEGKYYLI